MTKPVTLDYTNYRGERAERQIIPKKNMVQYNSIANQLGSLSRMLLAEMLRVMLY